MRYDIAIIGTGPAGISAAITAKIRNKSIILLGNSDLSAKMSKAHLIKNYTGLPSISGDELARQMQRHLDEMGIQITDKRVSAVYSMGDYFMLQLTGETVECSSVILACGVSPQNLLDGEEKFLGRGVSYCATCDAPLCKGKRVAVLAYTPEAEDEAKFLSELCDSVLYFPLYEAADKNIDGVEIVNDSPLSFDGTVNAEKIICKHGEYEVFNTFIIRESTAPDRLVPGLKVENGHVVVDLQMKTNIKGLFACGDVAGKPYQYIKAAGQGNVAALSAVRQLAQLNK